MVQVWKTKSLLFCLIKIWPTNHFLKVTSYNFHFRKNDVTWPLSANGLWRLQHLLLSECWWGDLQIAKSDPWWLWFRFVSCLINRLLRLMTKFMTRENWFVKHTIHENCQNLHVKRDHECLFATLYLLSIFKMGVNYSWLLHSILIPACYSFDLLSWNLFDPLGNTSCCVMQKLRMQAYACHGTKNPFKTKVGK